MESSFIKLQILRIKQNVTSEDVILASSVIAGSTVGVIHAIGLTQFVHGTVQGAIATKTFVTSGGVITMSKVVAPLGVKIFVGIITSICVSVIVYYLLFSLYNYYQKSKS